LLRFHFPLPPLLSFLEFGHMFGPSLGFFSRFLDKRGVGHMFAGESSVCLQHLPRISFPLTLFFTVVAGHEPSQPQPKPRMGFTTSAYFLFFVHLVFEINLARFNPFSLSSCRLFDTSFFPGWPHSYCPHCLPCPPSSPPFSKRNQGPLFFLTFLVCTGFFFLLLGKEFPISFFC